MEYFIYEYDGEDAIFVYIDKDPTRGHTLFTGNERKREILTPMAAATVFRAVWKDDRAKLANILAAVTGMGKFWPYA